MQSKRFGKAAGELFGDRYQIERQLGKRAGRYTLLARDLQTSAQVVIKRLSFGKDFVWDDLKLFEREAKTLKDLSHPAIPRYLDYFDLDLPTGKGFALVQTYIPAQSLEDHLNAGRTFSEAEIVELATELLKILRYLHERLPVVIHRDIKPSNILLGNWTGNSIGAVYLVDFGSVQTLAAHAGGTITVVGTYGYMPPEQFGDRATPASDLYALGSTLIYLATGKHPADLPQIDQRIQFENEAHLSLWLEQWLRKIVQPSLNQRFTSAQVALTTLKKRTFVSEALISQPDNSKAILKKKSNLLEIFLPSRAQTANLASLIVIISISQVLIFVNLIFLSIIVRIIMAVIANPSFIQFINYIFFIVIGWVFFLVPLVLKSMFFWSIRLRISRQDIRQDWVLFGLKILSIKKTDVSKINKLELNSRTKVKRSQGLWIRTDKQDFYLTASGQTEAELEWLAQELSLWLKQPIMRE